MCIKLQLAKMKGGDQLEEIEIDGKMILKWILRMRLRTTFVWIMTGYIDCSLRIRK
jgi:hypothetical protein